MVRALLLASITAIVFVMAVPAHALAPLNEQAYYALSWNGISLGRIRIEAEEDDSSYAMVVDTKSKGIVNIFSPFRTVATIHGDRIPGMYVPQRYQTRSEKNNDCENCGTTMTYDAAGNIIDRIRIPPDTDPTWRPEVPLEEANTGTDPITAYFVLREKLRRNTDQGLKETTVRTYDGKRLADMIFRLKDKRTLEVEGKEYPTLVTRISRKQIAGYTPKEKKKFAEGDPAITAIFSDDADMRLLRLEIALTLGSVVMQWAEEN